MPQKLTLTPNTPEARPGQRLSGPAHDDLTALARECPARLRELMWSGDERVSLAACQEVLNRGYGKPAPSTPGEGGGPALTVVVIKEGATDD